MQLITKNNDVYEGIFYASSIMENELGVAMKMVSKMDAFGNFVKTEENLIILGKDVCAVSAININIASNSRVDNDTFQTDTSITGISNTKGVRELKKWITSDPIKSNLTLDGHAGKGSWDQFEVNEKLFGVKTDYQEEIYTTVIDRSQPDFKIKEERAAMMAEEILKTETDNFHVAEERGRAMKSNRLDEEDLYGAVIRENPIVSSNKDAESQESKTGDQKDAKNRKFNMPVPQTKLELRGNQGNGDRKPSESKDKVNL